MSDKFSGDIDRRGSFLDYLVIILITVILITFVIWANFTKLDLVTTGSGRLIASGQNKNVQAPVMGTISGFFVEEGSRVAEGELIATINPTEALSRLEELEAKIDNKRIRLRRLDIELEKKGPDYLRSILQSKAADLVEAEILLLTSRVDSLKAQIETWNKKREGQEKEIVGIDAQLLGKQQLVDLVETELGEILPLISIGAVSKSERFKLDRDRTSLLSEINVLTEGKENLRISIEGINKEIASVVKKYETEILQERATTMGELTELTARLPAIQERLRETEIKSPIEGQVNVVFYNTVGAVVNTGEVLAEIVPSGDNLLIEAFIDPSDIATVEPGQNARIALTAYDAARYGYLYGTVTKVSPDTVFRDETKAYSYTVIIEINETIYEDDGSEVEIVPGMMSQVDIIRGSRTILEYMWQPFAKVKDTAFRE